jgi:hypothetical protein
VSDVLHGFVSQTIAITCGSTMPIIIRITASRKTADSFPDAVTADFSLLNCSNNSMFHGSTQPLRDMGTRNLPRAKSGQRLRLTTSPPSLRKFPRTYGSLDVSILAIDLLYLEKCQPLRQITASESVLLAKDLGLSTAIQVAVSVSLFRLQVFRPKNI